MAAGSERPHGWQPAGLGPPAGPPVAGRPVRPVPGSRARCAAEGAGHRGGPAPVLRAPAHEGRLDAPSALPAPGRPLAGTGRRRLGGVRPSVRTRSCAPRTTSSRSPGPPWPDSWCFRPGSRPRPRNRTLRGVAPGGPIRRAGSACRPFWPGSTPRWTGVAPRNSSGDCCWSSPPPENLPERPSEGPPTFRPWKRSEPTPRRPSRS